MIKAEMLVLCGKVKVNVVVVVVIVVVHVAMVSLVVGDSRRHSLCSESHTSVSLHKPKQDSNQLAKMCGVK